jgi:aryl-alcohol dehydrogenase-like predicted oxidoreductase
LIIKVIDYTESLNMQFTTLGRTGLTVSVAGLGCGGSSRLGLTAGHSIAQCAHIIESAVDLGVNLIDTAKAYGTESVVAQALKTIPRDSVILSTKQKINQGNTLLSAQQIIAGLDESLNTLGVDCIDIFFLHTVLPEAYAHAAQSIAPALIAEQKKGKFKFLGITEMPPKDHHHDMLQMALKDDFWDVIMFAFHLLGQNARDSVFPITQSKQIGTLIMFAVRSLFSTPGRLQSEIKQLADSGQLPIALNEAPYTLDFMLHPDNTQKIIDTAYRYTRHEPGSDVVLFGTSNPDHVASNIKSILSPKLPKEQLDAIRDLFGKLEGVGLDEPNLTPTTKTVSS